MPPKKYNQDSDLPTAPGAPEPLMLAAQDGAVVEEERKKLKVFNGEGDDGNRPVKVSVNGKAYLIPRDTEVMAPIAVINVLKDAVETRWTQNPDTREMISRDVPRFNFIVG